MDQFALWSIVTAVVLVTSVAVVLVRRRRFKTLLLQAATLIPPPNSVVWHRSALPTPLFQLANDPSYGLTVDDAIIVTSPPIVVAELLSSDVMDVLERLQNDAVAALEGSDGEQLVYRDAIASDDSVMVSGMGAAAAFAEPPVKNAGLDAAGAVAGGLLGMSIGRLLGGKLLGSAGSKTLVALLGLGGAILGRIVSDGAKKKTFQTAVDSPDGAPARALSGENQRRIDPIALARFIEDRDTALRDAVDKERRTFLAVVRDGRSKAVNERHLACEAFSSHLGAIQDRIWMGYSEFRKMHQSSILRRWLYPGEGDVAVELAGPWAQDVSSRVEQLRAFLLALLSSQDEGKWNEAARVIAQFIRTFECDADRYYGEIKVNAERIAAIQQIVEDEAQALDDRIKRLVAEAQREVNAFIDAGAL